MNKYICLAILVMFAGAATLSAGPEGPKNGKTTGSKKDGATKGEKDLKKKKPTKRK